MLKLRILCIVVSLLIPALLAAQNEEITSYIVSLSVEPDGDMLVVETIQVHALGQEIKHGIYRDFPTSHRADYGGRSRVDFSLLSVRRNGQPEPWKIENHEIRPGTNGVRIYVGDKDKQVPPGLHTYELSYKTGRQLGFKEDRVELYYNAIPTEWNFPIRSASVVVELPAEIPITAIRTAGFSGRMGESGQNFRARVRSADYIQYDIINPLGRHEGLTILLSWPRGYVKEPDKRQQDWDYARDNADSIVFMLGLLALFAYYYMSWLQVGRDPASGTIIPLYEPPDGLSPEEGRYIMRMRFDTRCLTTVVMQLAIKGHLQIHEAGGKFSLKRGKEGRGDISPVESQVMEQLLGPDESLELDRKNYSIIQRAEKALRKSMQLKHLNRTFYLNKSYLSVGVFMSAAVLFLAFAFNNFSPHETATLLNSFLCGAHFSLIFIFAWLLRAPSRFGRSIMDRIEGYKMYLGTAEREALNLINLPQLSPEIYEKHLPWAVALDLDSKWTRLFQQELHKAGMDPDTYQPHWYHGSRGWHDSGLFNRGLASSFASAMNTASSPAGSSGGSAGGGGGGGGGGGW